MIAGGRYQVETFRQGHGGRLPGFVTFRGESASKATNPVLVLIMAHSLRILLILCLAGANFAVRASSLAEILLCNGAALGGEAAFDRVGNLRIELDIREPGFEVTATYVASRDGRMRIDIYSGGEHVFTEGLDGGRAWQWTPEGGVSSQSAAGAAALRHGIAAPGRFWTLGQLRSRGAQVEWLEAMPSAGPVARPQEWQLRLTREDGSVIDYFVDRESCLPTREISRRAFHPDADATEVLIETVHGEPTRVDGVLRFRRGEQHDLGSGEWLGTTVVRRVEHNVALAEDFFEAK